MKKTYHIVLIPLFTLILLGCEQSAEEIARQTAGWNSLTPVQKVHRIAMIDNKKSENPDANAVIRYRQVNSYTHGVTPRNSEERQFIKDLGGRGIDIGRRTAYRSVEWLFINDENRIAFIEFREVDTGRSSQLCNGWPVRWYDSENKIDVSSLPCLVPLSKTYIGKTYGYSTKQDVLDAIDFARRAHKKYKECGWDGKSRAAELNITHCVWGADRVNPILQK